MTTPPQLRPFDVIVREQAGHLAFLATERVYAEQPGLWDLGEKGRHHTLDDFGHHFRALAGGPEAFSSHVAYCYRLFEERGFPRHWLDSAWQTMRRICEEQLDEPNRAMALQIIDLDPRG